MLGNEHTILPVGNWVMLADALLRHPVDVAVLDPQSTAGVQTDEVLWLLEQHPSLPVVLYTYLSPLMLGAVAELARYGVHQVVLHRFDDEPRRFLELLERQPGFAICETMLERLGGPLSRLPRSLARTVERLFRSPAQIHVSDLAHSAGMPVRMLYRKFEQAGLGSPRILVQSARLLRAYAYMRDPGLLLEDVAAKLRYQSPRALTNQMQDATGMTPTEVRNRLSPEEFVSTLATRLCVSAGRGAPGRSAMDES